MLRSRTGLCLLAISLIACSGAHAASFECSKARTAQERMVCADPGLSAADEQLAAVYADALRGSGTPDQLKADQRQWMVERNRCSEPECLRAAYSRRTGQLAGAAVAQSPPAQPPSCRQSIGAARARVLVQQCIQVSPATHPPCNDANPCEMITGEIQRGCGMLPSDVPAFCRRSP